MMMCVVLSRVLMLSAHKRNDETPPCKTTCVARNVLWLCVRRLIELSHLAYLCTKRHRAVRARASQLICVRAVNGFVHTSSAVFCDYNRVYNFDDVDFAGRLSNGLILTR